MDFFRVFFDLKSLLFLFVFLTEPKFNLEVQHFVGFPIKLFR